MGLVKNWDQIVLLVCIFKSSTWSIFKGRHQRKAKTVYAYLSCAFTSTKSKYVQTDQTCMCRVCDQQGNNKKGGSSHIKIK